MWMQRQFPACPFERYADDAIIHCDSENQARQMLDMLRQRFAECRLELHPELQFDFLGYTFRPRGAMNRSGKMFVSFIPAVSAKAIKAMRSDLRRWKLSHRGDLDLEALVQWLQPLVRGWVNYYRRFCPSHLYRALRMVDELLVRWALRKYTGRKKHAEWAWDWLKRLRSKQPTLFSHWQLVAAVG
jgi:hypothetical protein